MKGCRSCKGQLDFLFTLGNLYVNDFPEKPGNGLQAPLDLFKCSKCHLVQLGETVDADRLYSHFWYQSGTSKTIKDDLRQIVFEALGLAKPPLRGETVLDIGCNDGTLLRECPENMVKVGFEPAKNMAVKAQDSGNIFNHYFTADRYLAVFEPAKIVTSISMFYDLEDPNSFTRDVSRVLAPDGVWVNQFNYLPSMLENNCYDNICHEHLEYYSIKSLLPILHRQGLEPFKFQFNSINGGSIRVYASHQGAYPVQDNVEQFIGEEAQFELEKMRTYQRFEERITKLRQQLTEFTIAAKAGGKRVYVYGASTRGNTILQYCGLNSSLVGKAADAQKEKWGRLTVGTEIPIVSKEEARKDKPDYFLVLPYHLLREIQEQENQYLRNGGRFIVPLPEFRVVSGPLVAEIPQFATPP